MQAENSIQHHGFQQDHNFKIIDLKAGLRLNKRRLLFCIALVTSTLAQFTASAQLTVFNVSSSEISESRKISVQQQFEIEDVIESSTTLTYGLGRNWEAGINVINLDFNPNNRHIEVNDTSMTKPFAPLVLANSQKVFELNKTFSIGIGAVAGTNLTAHHQRFVYYGYSNLVASVGSEEQYQFAAGPYISNHRYLGEGPVYGAQIAVDAGIWNEKFHLLGDWISGNHQKGKLSLGFEVFLSRRLPLSVGWQRSNADGSQAAVVQLTLLAK
ncbi:hypothetical protein [Dyadobacter sp. CY326]|uniref:hypothetical protein n=1 Tax=Dyadobacter sp. CY326 TaxID=2907300 RepID=UPI001F3B732B|nr:hypothetical protein [Dyadobacter sp. CY326]MCE7064938.1 hypothetical protein [Dyadobacter sp. CY326]